MTEVTEEILDKVSTVRYGGTYHGRQSVSRETFTKRKGNKVNKQEITETWQANKERVYWHQSDTYDNGRPCVIRGLVEGKVRAGGTSRYPKYKTQLMARIQYWDARCWDETMRVSDWDGERFVSRDVARPTWKFTARWKVVPFREIRHVTGSASMGEWVMRMRDENAKHLSAEAERESVIPEINSLLRDLGYTGHVGSWDKNVQLAVSAKLRDVLRDALAYRESVAEKVA